MNMRGSKEGNINQYLADTISSVFSEVYTVDVKGATNRELLGMQMIDELIRDEVSYYRKVFDEGGIEALINLLQLMSLI